MERRTFLGVIAGGLLAAPLAAERRRQAEGPESAFCGMRAAPLRRRFTWVRYEKDLVNSVTSTERIWRW